ncbi:MAG: LPXTG cell wall anchor domain-containing protein, partial [Eubacterium sp.]|nr:LPXTG cell wall anchor domain-containing protein [Eubacterium sp.]
VDTALIGIGIAMGICVIVTSVLKQLDTNSAVTLLGIGLSSIGIYLLKNKNNKQ